uniref:K Homology domain-containing protein n=1 Tax=Fagus sylvatica TaxID=28930 RepID=A0A2N9F7Z0_FAGSY
MADEAQYSSGPDSASNKRKYDDQTAPPPATRRPTGFSAPIAPHSPDSSLAPPPPSYNTVPPPVDGLTLAKQRAQEVAARLFNNSGAGAVAATAGLDAKRPKIENGASGFDSHDSGFSSVPPDLKPHTLSAAPLAPMSYGYQNSSTSKKIDIPNGRVGVIIGKGGETIKYLQLQSGAKIQVTRDMDADPNSPTRMVELMGTPEQIAKAEQLITEVLSEVAEAGGSGVVSRRLTGQSGAEKFVMKIPNNKVGLVIGKGGETIKNMQARTGARIQVIPLHLPPGDTSTERTLQIDGTSEQLESAKQLVNEVISEIGSAFLLFNGSGVHAKATGDHLEERNFMMVSVYWTIGDTNIQFFVLVFPQHHSGRGWASAGVTQYLLNQYGIIAEKFSMVICGNNFVQNRVRNPAMAGGYPQQGYQARPPTGWGTPGAPPVQQPGYGYVQPGTYPGPSPQYNMSQPSYPGYPPQPASGGYAANWDQSTVPPSQQTSQASGYDYYSQQPSQQQQTPGGPAAPADNSGYNYGQPPASGYNQQGQGYTQDGYGGYHAAPQSGYGQPPAYDQQQGYASAPSYGNVSNPTQDGHTPSYGSQGDSTQAPTVQPSSAGQQGYTSGQQPSLSPASYPAQGTTQPGYGIPPTSQTGYGNQLPAQSGYGPGYGAPQAQKPLANPPVYGQPTQSPGTPGGYGQPAPVQPGYPHSQPPTSSYAQPDSGPQRAPPSNYGAAAGQPGYGAPPYGAPPVSQPGYGQAPPPYNTYGSAYSQPPVYSADGNAGGNTRGTYDAAPASQTAPQSGVAKTSPQS